MMVVLINMSGKHLSSNYLSRQNNDQELYEKNVRRNFNTEYQ